jgi:3',5'-cyclic AMP phosphodiesterase CpdA
VNLWAISDLHVGYEENRQAVAALEPMPDDWLIIAGDTGETPTHLDFVLKALVPRFAQIVWTVGNHDLWTPHSLPPERRGVAHYERLVRLCRSYGVLTPEDPFAVWPGDGPRTAIVPTFGLYDYTFRPASVPADDAVAWAAAAGVRCADEDLLSPSPFGSRQEWCAARVGHTEQRLEMIHKTRASSWSITGRCCTSTVSRRASRVFRSGAGPRRRPIGIVAIASTPSCTVTCICAARGSATA